MKSQAEFQKTFRFLNFKTKSLMFIIAILIFTRNVRAQEYATQKEHKIINEYLLKNTGRIVGNGTFQNLVDSVVYAYSGVNNMFELLYFNDENGLDKYFINSIDSAIPLDLVYFSNLYYVIERDELGDIVEVDTISIGGLSFLRVYNGNLKLILTDQSMEPVESYELDLSEYIYGGDEFADRKKGINVFRLPNKKELRKIAKRTATLKKNKFKN